MDEPSEAERDQSVTLDRFDPALGYSKGRSRLTETIWYGVKCIFFLPPIPWPSTLKTSLLRAFGASVGIGLKIQPRVNVHLPWRLTIGDHCWIGQECELLNFEHITLGNHVALAHRVYLATGNHDYTDPSMRYRNAPIVIEDGVWVASCTFIGPGVTIGRNAVVSAGSIVTRSVIESTIVRGNPAQVVRTRVLRDPQD